MATKTFAIGGDCTVRRLGFGAMRVCGQGIWGYPPSRTDACALLRRAVYLGVDLIDTADAYGPEVSEYLIADALYPYPDNLVVATKGGLVRGGPGSWTTDGRPEHLMRACENSLRRLRRDTIDLYQLHAVDDDVPFADSVGALARLKEQGKIRHVGLSNVTTAQVAEARKIVPIATVQNRYNLTDKKHAAVLEYCTENGIGFIPWYPLATGELASDDGPLGKTAEAHSATPGQVALAWLLHKSDVVLPIPGTSSIAHLEENCGGDAFDLTDEEFATIDALQV